ncbi:MAG TPA: hypothetical protein VKV05_06675, partial [Terriglobales bacterium]|nr:hypothetical protein [Terriglobales bacterium]
FTPAIGQETLHLFPIPPALRFWRWSQVEWLGDGAFYGKNPTYGAQLSYFLNKEIKEPGTLVITDSQGRVVRTMKGTHTLEEGEKPPAEEDVPPPALLEAQASRQSEQKEAKPSQPATPTQAQQQVVPPKPNAEEAEAGQPKRIPWVPTKPGLQRLYWDLRADGPVRWEDAKGFNKGPRSGALVPPGEYTATMNVGGTTVSQKIQVVNDPRSRGDQASIEASYQLAEAVLHEISQLDVALNRLDAINAQVKALAVVAKDTPDEQPLKESSDKLIQQLKQVQAEITSNAGAEESVLRVPAKVREKLFGLSWALQGSDQAPTAAMLEDKERLDHEYQAALEKFNQFLQTDVSAFNSVMAQHKLTGVVIGEPIQP